MARSEARVKTRIWDDADFLRLEPYQKLVYLFLISQPDISHCGVLSLRLRRWAKKLSYTPKRLDEALDGLAKTRFIVVDDDEEELLVRSFIRGDEVYRQPKVLLAASRQLAEVSSLHIRDALATEVQRILQEGSAGPNTRPTLLVMLSTLGRVADTPPDTHSEGYAEGYGKPSAIPKPLGTGVGVGVGEELKVRSSSSFSPSGETKKPSAKRGTRLPEDFAVTDDMTAWAKKSAPAVDLAFETDQFVDYWSSKPTNATKLNWDATWRSWMRKAQKDAAERAARRGPEPEARRIDSTDERCRAHPTEPAHACLICDSETRGE